MAQPTYYELLRRPEWQRKRLEVMHANSFACEECGADDKTLNVHHRHYVKGRKPWEYDLPALACLCEGCHAEWHGKKAIVDEYFGRLATHEGVQVMGYILALYVQRNSDPVNDLRVQVRSYEEAVGVADVYWLRAGDVIDALDADGWISNKQLWSLPRRGNG